MSRNKNCEEENILTHARTKIKRNTLLIFAVLLLTACLLCVAPMSAAAAQTPPFAAQTTVSGNTATVSLRTSAQMEYSSLEVKLGAELPQGIKLAGIAAGADLTAFSPSEEPNVGEGNGLFAILNEDVNVQVPAGKELVVYTFDVSEAAAGKHVVKFKFTAASDIDGNAYGWEDGTVTAEIAVEKEAAPPGPTQGPSQDSYPITVADTANGTVSLSKTSAKSGEKIVVTPGPNSGYAVEEVAVFGPDGIKLTVTYSGGVYSFVMPKGAVSVKVTFKSSHTCYARNYTDVDLNAWYHESVDYVLGKGLMNGYGNGLFAPGGSATRAMVVTVLYRMEGSPSVGAQVPFSDVKAGEWYTAAVVWANENGIVQGYGNGVFGIDDTVSREQFAAILYRYAKYKGYGAGAGNSADLSAYNDAGSISSWAAESMQWACGAGILNGDGAHNLNPANGTSRAETAALLMRFEKNVK